MMPEPTTATSTVSPGSADATADTARLLLLQRVQAGFKYQDGHLPWHRAWARALIVMSWMSARRFMITSLTS